MTTARSNGTGGAAAREMPPTHRIVRRRLAAVAALVPAVSAHDAARVDAVAGHLALLLDEEEREVVPLIDQHLSAAEWQDVGEWQEVGERGFEQVTPAQRWIALGQRSCRRHVAPVRGRTGGPGGGR